MHINCPQPQSQSKAEPVYSAGTYNVATGLYDYTCTEVYSYSCTEESMDLFKVDQQGRLTFANAHVFPEASTLHQKNIDWVNTIKLTKV